MEFRLSLLSWQETAVGEGGVLPRAPLVSLSFLTCKMGTMLTVRTLYVVRRVGACDPGGWCPRPGAGWELGAHLTGSSAFRSACLVRCPRPSPHLAEELREADGLSLWEQTVQERRSHRGGRGRRAMKSQFSCPLLVLALQAGLLGRGGGHVGR